MDYFIIINSGFLSLPDKEVIKITLSKVLISFNIGAKSHYSLLSIIQLMELKSEMIVKIKTNHCEFTATNVKFDYIQFNDETMILSFNKCSFEIDSLNNILNIDSVDNTPLRDFIKKSLEILESYPEKETQKLKSYLLNF